MTHKYLSAVVAATLLTGCASLCPSKPGAAAQLLATAGNSTTGTVSFTQRGDKVLVEADVSGLTPGEHGFHIHEKGDCSAADASSAGGHFNPGAQAHGRAGQGAHHAGDTDNIVADARGIAHVNAHVSGVSLGGGAANDIAGRAIIVHAQADDYATQPTGNAGARVACGVIQVVR